MVSIGFFIVQLNCKIVNCTVLVSIFFLLSMKWIFSIFLISPIYSNIFFYNARQGSELPGRLWVLIKCNNLEYDHSPDHKGLLLQTDAWDNYRHIPANSVTQLLQCSHSYLQNQTERDILNNIWVWHITIVIVFIIVPSTDTGWSAIVNLIQCQA